MAELTQTDLILKTKISQRVKGLREDSGLSQIEFSKAHDIDRQILNRWESSRNKRGVTIYTVSKFCKMVGISLKDFFDHEIFK